MLKHHSNFTSLLTILLISTGSPMIAQAQNSAAIPAVTESNSTQTVRPLRRKRVVQPVEYWVESSSLNLRDNPVAGNIVGTIEYGQKVFAYSQYENWVQISKSAEKGRWVNSDFLSNSPLSWVSYTRNRPTLASDITSVRIKDPENKKKRIFGVRLKTADTGNVLITTKEETSQGSYFQNRFVSCDGKAVVGMRLVGEGSSFLSAQNDFRNQSYNIYESDTVKDDAATSEDRVISKFACKSRPF